MTAVAAICLMSACGGSETSFFQYTPAAPTGFDNLVSVSEDYEDRFSGPAESQHRVSVGAEVPQSGSANFAGYMTVGPARLAPFDPNAFTAGAETTVSVNFDTGVVTGETSQFYDISNPLDPTGTSYGRRVDGSVDYDLTSVATSDNGFIGEATGELTVQDGRNFVVNEVVTGAVMTPDAEAFRVVSTDELGLDIQVYTLRE